MQSYSSTKLSSGQGFTDISLLWENTDQTEQVFLLMLFCHPSCHSFLPCTRTNWWQNTFLFQIIWSNQLKNQHFQQLRPIYNHSKGKDQQGCRGLLILQMLLTQVYTELWLPCHLLPWQLAEVAFLWAIPGKVQRSKMRNSLKKNGRGGGGRNGKKRRKCN